MDKDKECYGMIMLKKLQVLIFLDDFSLMNSPSPHC